MAQQTINNSESGLVVRTKLNDNFTELYTTKQDESVIVSGNQTATNDSYYVNVANATYTDPSPVEGKGFVVFVRNGTATIGGTAYSTAGNIIHRLFHSGGWANYVSGGITSNPTGITGADQVTNAVSLTTAEYTALGSPNASTLYVITDAT